jgi:hypothetical protein
MAKPKRNLVRLLERLNEKPMFLADIRKVLGIKERTGYAIVKETLKKEWIKEDGLKRYNITIKGKSMIGIWEKIKQLDEIASIPSDYRSEFSENMTGIKSAIAKIVDRILVLRIKKEEMKLFGVRDGELAERFTPLNIDTYFPGYDYRKRFMSLAKTNIKILIEFDGEKWVELHRFNHLEAQHANNMKFYKAIKNIKSKERKERLIQALDLLWASKKSQYIYVNLSEAKEELEEYVCKVFEEYEEKDKVDGLVKKAIETGLFEYGKKELYYLKVNRDKLQEFLRQIT